MKYAILGSGSSANAYIFEIDDFAFVIDNGFSYKQFAHRAEELGFDLGKIKLIFITHIHRDHISGIGPLSRKLKVPVVRHSDLSLTRFVPGELDKELSVLPGEEYTFQKLRFIPFSTSHDAPHPISFHFTLGETTFTILTDTGKVTPEILYYATRSDVLFLEANYNEHMLVTGPYPLHLKKRILSPRGHLSNADAVTLLNNIVGLPESRLRLTYLCHMSDTNNSPEQLSSDLVDGLACSGTYFICKKNAMQIGLDPQACERWVKS
jgi:phosphoribosyl 1,2-cyclic phosphodiesterase